MKEQKTADFIKERYPFYDEDLATRDVELNGEQVQELMQSYSDQQNAELLAWKESAMKELNTLDLQSLGNKLGIGLGQAVSENLHSKVDGLLERVRELEGEVNRTIDNLHMEIHVMITDARIAVTKLGIDPGKSEAVDRLLYDLDVLQGKMMDAFKTEEKK